VTISRHSGRIVRGQSPLIRADNKLYQPLSNSLLSEDIGMSKPRVLTGILSAAFLLMLVSSARADSQHSDKLLEKLIYADTHNLIVLDNQLDETGYLYAGHFDNNNGKHLGFSIAAFNGGPRLGIVRPTTPAAVTQNPEPTAMVLLGTGLAAVAAFARKKSRKRAR
jgi:PEP-CTERM motif